jgi:regulator of RNase E activity RraA
MDHGFGMSLRLWVAVSLAVFAVCSVTFVIHGQAQAVAGSELTQAAMVEGFKHVEVASVSDAIEQLLHQKQYMSHSMRPIFPTRFAGKALTVKLVKQENTTSADLNGMLEAIDRGGPGSVYVMQLEDGADIAGMGGLMGTAMASRGFSGAIIGGGVRDLPQLTRIGFPVYAQGIVPSTAVGHYRFVGMNVPIVCDGVNVSPDDIIVADPDGVVVVPHEKAAEILTLAQKLDNTEHSMYPIIEKLHSIVEAVKQFGRI